MRVDASCASNKYGWPTNSSPFNISLYKLFQSSNSGLVFCFALSSVFPHSAICHASGEVTDPLELVLHPEARDSSL